MGDFIKESTDPANILSAVFVIGSTALAGPAGFLASSSAVLGASQAVKAGAAAENELKVAARQEELAAKDREAQRRTRLLTVLGAQRAAAAAGGIGFSGSTANVSIQDAERASLDRIVDRSNTRITLDTLRNRGRNIRRGSVLSAGASILSTGATLAQGQVINKPKTTTQGAK